MGHCITARTALQHVECLLGPSECPIQQVLHQSIRTHVKAHPCALHWNFHTIFGGKNARAHAAMRCREVSVLINGACHGSADMVLFSTTCGPSAYPSMAQADGPLAGG